MASWDYKIVWPKDGAKGKRPRGFFGGLSDIIRGKGPDMFVQTHRQGKIPVELDRWANWDSYHAPNYRDQEQLQTNGLRTTSRGLKRYDPETRRYTEWEMAEDFRNFGTHGEGTFWRTGEGYPRFTAKERKRLARQQQQGKFVDLQNFAKDWDELGPKRFHSKHRDFWAKSHRVMENQQLWRPLKASSLPPTDPHSLHMYGHTWYDLNNWTRPFDELRNRRKEPVRVSLYGKGIL